MHNISPKFITESKPFALTQQYRQETVALYPPRSRCYSGLATRKDDIAPRIAYRIFLMNVIIECQNVFLR